jgi:hypothetical protein
MASNQLQPMPLASKLAAILLGSWLLRIRLGLRGIADGLCQHLA